MEKKKKVFVGLSGGVDSAVSALLLKRQGYDVTGVFIKVWTPDFLPCTWREERRDAMRVAVALDIPFISLDFSEEYKRDVVDYIVEEYKKGRTPNPDVMCNRGLKFGAFLREARARGADFIATGHYARCVSRDSVSDLRKEVLSSADDQRGKFATDKSSFLLQEGEDPNKDQSYFLWTLREEDLPHILFPIGNLKKSEVRALAKGAHLPVAEKRDSQGICFIGDVSMDEFLSHFVSTEQGSVLNTQGEVIGVHNGALHYTIGERHGFTVTKKGTSDKPYFVVAKDMIENTITVSNEDVEIEALSPSRVEMSNVNWITNPEGRNLSARIRYRQEKVPVRVEGEKVTFSAPVRGLSFGQSIVFYDGDICVGGGIMERS